MDEFSEEELQKISNFVKEKRVLWGCDVSDKPDRIATGRVLVDGTAIRIFPTIDQIRPSPMLVNVDYESIEPRLTASISRIDSVYTSFIDTQEQVVIQKQKLEQKLLFTHYNDPRLVNVDTKYINEFIDYCFKAFENTIVPSKEKLYDAMGSVVHAELQYSDVTLPFILNRVIVKRKYLSNQFKKCFDKKNFLLFAISMDAMENNISFDDSCKKYSVKKSILLPIFTKVKALYSSHKKLTRGHLDA